MTDAPGSINALEERIRILESGLKERDREIARLSQTKEDMLKERRDLLAASEEAYRQIDAVLTTLTLLARRLP